MRSVLGMIAKGSIIGQKLAHSRWRAVIVPIPCGTGSEIGKIGLCRVIGRTMSWLGFDSPFATIVSIQLIFNLKRLGVCSCVENA